MKHKTRLLPLAGLLLAGGILCTGCGGAAPASSAPAAVSTASSVEEVSAMDGYDYLNDYIGLWGYYDIDLWLRVHEDSTFEFVNSEDEAIYTGTADADEYGMDLYFDDDTPQMRLDLSVSGDLLEVGSSDALHPVDAIVSRATCFEKNGLEINAAVDSSDPIQLDSGVCSFTGKGSGYNTDLCYWQVTKYNDVTHDGIREIQFDAVCYIPDSSIPYFGQTYETYISSELYDAYTGTWLTASTARGDTGRDKNHYYHTVYWNDNAYDIEFFFSTDWNMSSTSDDKIFTKSYVVYLPEDYDGLVFAAQAQPDNYADAMALDNLENVSPEGNIMDLSPLDPYASLYFNICGRAGQRKGGHYALWNALCNRSGASSGVAAQQPEGGRTAGCGSPHRSGGAGCRVSGGAVCTQWPDHLLWRIGASAAPV